METDYGTLVSDCVLFSGFRFRKWINAFFFFFLERIHACFNFIIEKRKRKKKKRGVLGGTKQDLEFWKTLKALPYESCLDILPCKTNIYARLVARHRRGTCKE